MTRLIIFIVFILFNTSVLFAQEKPQYAVSLIPDSLMKGVNSVIREQSDLLIFKKPGKGKQVIKKVVTVLNEKAEEELVFYEFYDQLRKIDDIEINIYDGKGAYLKRSRKRDLRTESVGDGISLLTDTKVIYAPLSVDKYPATIEINYEIIYEGTHEYADFFPQTTDQSIIKKTYTITTPDDNKVRFKNYRTTLKPKVNTTDGLTTLTWEVNNVQPFQKEPGSAREDVPNVKIAPSSFEVEDYPGNLDSWDNFGKWNNLLQKGINKLPAESHSFYKNMVNSAKGDREKIAILYRHLQENYRYVSIQLGIGGNKPFPADFVEKKKYGDCKALSNFMHAMLDAVGIPSHYTIINADYNSMPVDKDFPQDAFNHIILCVPLPKENDTVWLECTSRTQSFGKLGNFTENRYGLLVTETGGKLVPTPRSKPDDNTMYNKTVVKLSGDGSGTASMEVAHTGEYTELINSLFDGSEDDRKSYLVNRLGLRQPDRLEMKKTNVKSRNEYTVLYTMEFEKIQEFNAGAKYFFHPQLYKFWTFNVPKMEKRENDYYMQFPLMMNDTTVFQLPAEFTVESLPKPATIKFSLGEYQTDYTFNKESMQVSSISRIKLNQHIIPASMYKEAFVFFNDVLKHQQQKIILKKES